MDTLNHDFAEADYVLIEENLKKTRSLTERMTTILGTFDRRLVKLESSILPIHKSTQALKSKAGNLDKTMQEIEQVLAYYRIVQDEEGTIQAGVVGSDISRYFDSLSRIKEGLEYLESLRMRSADRSIAQMNQLLKAGTLQLEINLKAMLSSISMPINPEEYVGRDRSIPSPSEKVINRIKAVSTYLLECNSDVASLYSDLRSVYLQKSLASLAKASVSNVETPSSQLPVSGAFIMYTRALVEILKEEVRVIAQIFTEDDRCHVFSETMQGCLSSYIETGREINTIVKRNLHVNIFQAFEIIEAISAYSAEFDDLTKKQAGRKDNEINELLHVVRGTCLRSFPEFLEDIRGGFTQRIPLSTDGNVSELTKSTLSYMQQLSGYSETVEKMLSLLGDGKWNLGGASSTPSSVIESTTPILAHYFADTLEALSSVLESRARMLRKPGLSALFLINNYGHIARVIASSKIAEIVGKQERAICERNVGKQTGVYLDSWKGVVEQLMDVTIVKSGSLKTSLGGSNDRQNIKDRFKHFNEELTELYRAQRQYRVPDEELKIKLVDELKKMIVPMYLRFLDKYQDSEFTRNKEKYIRYDRNQLEGLLESLFQPES